MFKHIDLGSLSIREGEEEGVFASGNWFYLITCGIAVILLLIALAWIVAFEAPHIVGLHDSISSNIDRSGVSNPVTAVLLNFRAYDTLLEIAVLIIAMLAIPHLPSEAPFVIRCATHENRDPVIEGLQRLLVPITVLVAGYMLWTGASNPGGAFQAGALAAGAGVLLLQSGGFYFNFDALMARCLAVIGLLVFVIAALVPLLSGANLLTFAPQAAGVIIIFVETAATASISLILLSLYQGIDYRSALVND